MAPDLHSPTFYANVPDLLLFLFDSWNYYMDCIRMDGNHILCVKEKLSAAPDRSPSENYFCLSTFIAVLCVPVCYSAVSPFVVERKR